MSDPVRAPVTRAAHQAAGTKICASCQTAKDRGEFPTKSGGRGRCCYTCEGIEKPGPGQKRCTECRANKPEDEFYLFRKGGTERQQRCKRCDVDRAAGRARTETGSGKPRAGKACCVCAGMPWARYDREHGEPEPPAGTPCPGCDKPFAPESRSGVDAFGGFHGQRGEIV